MVRSSRTFEVEKARVRVGFRHVHPPIVTAQVPRSRTLGTKTFSRSDRSPLHRTRPQPRLFPFNGNRLVARFPKSFRYLDLPLLSK